MPEHRSNPDELLRRIQVQAVMAGRARFKIFFGASPGVGKTYAMLEAAQRARSEGHDVVVGLAETHGRIETMALLQGLEVLPRRTVLHRGRSLAEFDLDAALRRKPALLLVDELAHTNAPGSRHPKRWQDVSELLQAGIDVWSTLNVQHLESLNDVVAQISGVRVRETLPDSMLERADEVELVDLPPDALLERLREGRVYAPDQASRAEGGFFKRGNLLALRELALRRTAERVETDVLAHRRDQGIDATWPVAEHIVVCAGPTASSADLIRAAKRMAAGLRARWTAVSVELPHVALSAAGQQRLRDNLRLAEQLGAQVAVLSGTRVSDALLSWARTNNVTRIILGKPTHPRWRDILYGSVLDEVVRGSGDIDVHAISPETNTKPGGAAAERQIQPATRWRDYGFAIAVMVLTTGLDALLHGLLETSELVMVYLLGVVLVSTRVGRGPSLLAAALAVLGYDFFFVPPRFTFAVSDTRYFLTFAVLFVVGVVISGLTARVRGQATHARAREQRTAALYALSRELASARELGEVIASARSHVGGLFDVGLALLPAVADRQLAELPVHTDFAFDERDRSVAVWVFEHDRAAGLSTDTLPSARCLFLPLSSAGHQLGVLGILPGDPSRLLDTAQRQLLDTFVNQIALAMERIALEAQAQAARRHAERQELRNTLLSSVSHDLRTPLAAITGSATTMLGDAALTPAVRKELLETVREEAERLNRLVGNLLDMTRLESGGLLPKKDWIPLEEVVGSALDRAGHTLHGHEVQVRLAPDLPLLELDGVLIEQVLLNLLDNAVKYTTPETAIEISAHVQSDHVVVEVADRGPGLPEGTQSRIFDKFFRAPSGTGARGTGLGLAIVHGIVTAHGGTVSASNRSGGGAVFRFTLPTEASPPAMPQED